MSNEQIKTLVNAEQLKKLKKAMPAYREYESIDQAMDDLKAVAEKTDDFFGVPVFHRHDLFSDAWEGTRVIVARMGKIVNGHDGKVQGVQAIVVIPTFSVEEFMADEQGAKMLAKILDKELRLVHMRAYRDALTSGEFEAGMAASPATITDYATAAERGGHGMDMDGFNQIYSTIRDFIKSEQPQIHPLLPPKGELVKCLRSKSYALAEYPQLEENASGTSIFDWVSALLIRYAEAEGVDTATIKTWAESRDEVNFAVTQKDYSALDNLTLDLG